VSASGRACHAFPDGKAAAAIQWRPELVADESAPMVADGAEGESYNYGQEGFSNFLPDEPAREWFGQAILVPDLRE
jgi:hypothetical protein